MSIGARQLVEWLDRSRLADKDLASRLGISRAYLSQLLSGKRRPGLDIAELIYTHTGVPMTSWKDNLLSDLDRTPRVDRRRKPVSVEKSIVSSKLTEA